MEGVWQITGVAWRGLVQVAAGPDPAVARHQRSPKQRWAVRAMLAVALLALCTASLASLNDGYGLVILGFGAQHVPNG